MVGIVSMGVNFPCEAMDATKEGYEMGGEPHDFEIIEWKAYSNKYHQGYHLNPMKVLAN